MQDSLEILDDYGIQHAGNRDYFASHLKRYQVTLDMIGLGRDRAPRILELGGGGLAFSLLLRDRYPKAEIVIGEYAGGRFDRQHSVTNRRTGHVETFQAHSFNIETDEWPLPNEHFDLVLCMEILEHLMIDPLHTFREAHRVLRPGGRLLVTTPNIISTEALQKMLDMDSPYLFGVFSRHGAYGRHNREYTPWEVNALGEAAGLDADVLVTQDVYPPARDTSQLRSLLGDRLGPEHLRRQNIFYLGRKGERPIAGYPSHLFDFDPGTHRARIQLQAGQALCTVHSTLSARVTLANQGTYTWQTSGDDRTRLRVMLLDDQGGVRQRDYLAVDLPGPVPPGGNCTLELRVPAPRQLGPWCLRLDMVHENVCWFSEHRSACVDWPVHVVPRRYWPLHWLSRRLRMLFST